MLYVWLGLYAAYFFTPRHAAAQLGLMAGAYLVVLVAYVRARRRAGGLAHAGRASCSRPRAFCAPSATASRSSCSGSPRRRSPTRSPGLRNRLALDRELHAEVERALRAEEPLSLVIGDLDYFKSVNDRLGHRAGDEALVRAGRRADAAPPRRRLDRPHRRRGVHDPAARRDRARGLPRSPSGCAPRSSASSPATPPRSRSRSGSRRSRTTAARADAVLEAADQALYAAKALGRNRCVIFNPEIAAIFAPEAGRGADEVQLATLLSLAEALDLRDTGTADHSRTVGRYCAMIAEELGLPPERVKRIEIAGILHDIGKIGLPDAILQKPGPLGEDGAGRDPHPSGDRRADPQRARTRGPARVGARPPRAPGRERLPARAEGRRDPARGEDPRRGGRLRGDDRRPRLPRRAWTSAPRATSSCAARASSSTRAWSPPSSRC